MRAERRELSDPFPILAAGRESLPTVSNPARRTDRQAEEQVRSRATREWCRPRAFAAQSQQCAAGLLSRTVASRDGRASATDHPDAGLNASCLYECRACGGGQEHSRARRERPIPSRCCWNTTSVTFPARLWRRSTARIRLRAGAPNPLESISALPRIQRAVAPIQQRLHHHRFWQLHEARHSFSQAQRDNAEGHSDIFAMTARARDREIFFARPVRRRRAECRAEKTSPREETRTLRSASMRLRHRS